MSARQDAQRLRAILRLPRLAEIFEEAGRGGYRDGAPGTSLHDVTFAEEPDPPPWFVRVVLGIGAWVASTLVILFLAAADLLESDVAPLMLGLLLLGVGGGIRATLRHDFFRQLAIAFGLAGIGLSVFGVSRLSHEDAATEGFALALGAAILAFFPDTLLRFTGASTAAGALLLLCLRTHVEGAFDLGVVLLMVTAALLWLAPSRLDLGLLGARRSPAMYALVAAVLVALAISSSQEGSREMAILRWPTTVAFALGLLLLAAYALRRGGRSLASESGAALLVAIGAVAAATWHTPGILAALLVFALAVQRRSVVLMGLACVFLAGFLSFFYYSLSLSLFAKSGTLVGSGAALLALGFYLHRRHAPRGPEPTPAPAPAPGPEPGTEEEE